MNMLKYLPNKAECPLCKGTLKRERYDIYCSRCGLVVFDYTPPSANELDFIIDLEFYINILEEEKREKISKQKI